MDTLLEIKDQITQINGKFAEVDKRQSLLEQSHKFMSDKWEDVEERIFGVIGELRASMMEKFGDISHILKDNGQLGLITRVSVLESKQRESEARRDEGQKQDARLWAKLTPFFPIITLILGAAAMWFVKK